MMTGIPNHNFHVMNIFIRTGHQMHRPYCPNNGQLRISWGQVLDHGNTRQQIYCKDKALEV